MGRAVADGLAAVFRNLLQTLGAFLVAVVAYTVSICTCLGWIFVLPVLMWGVYRFLLQLVDGRAEVSATWSGLEVPGRAFGQMWGIVLLYLVLMLPLFAVLAVVSLFTGAGAAFGLDTGFEPIGPVANAIVSLVVSTLYGFLVVRFVFAPFLIVDRGLGAIDAFRDAWRASGPVWGKLVLLQLVVVLLTLPSQALTVGMQLLNQNVEQNPEVAIDHLGTVLALAAGWYLLLGIGSVLGMAIMAAAYRQLFGKPAG